MKFLKDAFDEFFDLIRTEFKSNIPNSDIIQRPMRPLKDGLYEIYREGGLQAHQKAFEEIYETNQFYSSNEEDIQMGIFRDESYLVRGMIFLERDQLLFDRKILQFEKNDVFIWNPNVTVTLPKKKHRYLTFAPKAWAGPLQKKKVELAQKFGRKTRWNPLKIELVPSK